MRSSKNRFILSAAALLLMSGCGADFTGGTRFQDPPQEQEALGARPHSFDTRLNNRFRVFGKECRGDETTEAFGRGDNCLAGQYLVSLDNVNTCTDNDTCTGKIVIPVVVELEDMNTRSPGKAVFELRGVSVMTSTQKNLLEELLVISDVKGNGLVRLR